MRFTPAGYRAGPSMKWTGMPFRSANVRTRATAGSRPSHTTTTASASGMRWGETGADAVCHLRALFRSQKTQWDDYWASLAALLC